MALGLDRLRPTGRQVNLLLEVLLVTSLVTGVVSWAVDLSLARPFTFLHAMSGFSILVVAPLKIRGPVRTGMRRGRSSRWLSVAFGVAVLVAIGLGIAHSTGLWYGVGYWSALWTHLLVGFAVVPLLVWHITTRPVRPGRVDLTRRALLTSSATAVTAAAVVGTQELVVATIGLDGADRAGTGSHELASFDPPSMPVVSWFDDAIPRDDLDGWEVLIDGELADLDAIAAATRPMNAWLDCTGGWRSEQRWDVVPLADVIGEGPGRSILVTSATGYSRLFGRGSAGDVFVCTGYDGQPLRRGHGAPLRLVVPGRRGPWWVKWITSIERTDRPAWLQLPFPPT